MDCSGIAGEARQRWIREIGDIVASLPELMAALDRPSVDGQLDFSIWLGLPEPESDYAPWGTALRDVLRHFGFHVITSHSALSHLVDAQLAKADLIVMFAVTKNVDVECVECCPKHGSKMVVCYPNEHMTTRAYSTLSRKYRIEIINFSLLSLGQSSQSVLGTEIFHCASDRLLAKRAELARQLKLKESVIVLVHGILSRGHWQNAIKTQLKRAGFLVESTNSGWVDIFSFFLPINWIRRRPALRVWRDLVAIRENYPGTRISVLAHSFGTFIVGMLFAIQPEFSVERVAFCGSILPVDFPFANYRSRFSTILNDVGCKDPLPALGASSTWGYGPTGTYGFNRPNIEDRWHRNLGHGGFLNPHFCDTYWTPFFADGSIIPGDENAEKPPMWVRIISGLHIKYVVLALIVSYPVYRLWPLVREFLPTIPSWL
jgi:pimeloyl-ACP methyl ester carboxylesterase